MMEASERRLGDSVILRARGGIDLSNAEDFKERLLSSVQISETALIIDFSEVDYVSSAGLRALMIASKTARPQGVAVAVASLTPVVKEIFTISRFDLVVPCFDSVRAAVAELDPAALEKLDGA
jgi:anti-anti-sigma factor